MSRVALVSAVLAVAAVGVRPAALYAQDLPSVSTSVEGTRITYRVSNLPARSADFRTVITTVTEPPGARYPELTVVFTDIASGREVRRVEVVSLGLVVNRQGGGLVQAEGDATARAREVNDALREMRAQPLGQGAEATGVDAARGTSEVSLDTMVVRSSGGRVRVVDPGDPRHAYLAAPLPQPTGLTPACRRVVRPYVTTAWLVGADRILARLAYATTPACPVPAPTAWWTHEVVAGL